MSGKTTSGSTGSCSLTAYRITPQGFQWGKSNKDQTIVNCGLNVKQIGSYTCVFIKIIKFTWTWNRQTIFSTSLTPLQGLELCSFFILSRLLASPGVAISIGSGHWPQSRRVLAHPRGKGADALEPRGVEFVVCWDQRGAEVVKSKDKLGDLSQTPRWYFPGFLHGVTWSEDRMFFGRCSVLSWTAVLRDFKGRTMAFGTTTSWVRSTIPPWSTAFAWHGVRAGELNRDDWISATVTGDLISQYLSRSCQNQTTSYCIPRYPAYIHIYIYIYNLYIYKLVQNSRMVITGHDWMDDIFELFDIKIFNGKMLSFWSASLRWRTPASTTMNVTGGFPLVGCLRKFPDPKAEAVELVEFISRCYMMLFSIWFLLSNCDAVNQ